MTNWRYIAQRATTGEFLDYEVPFVDRSELSWAMSAAGYLKGSVPSATGLAVAQDGRPLLEEWNTLLYAEADGEIRWGGIVISSEVNGDSWDVEAATFATYPSGMPYLGEYRGVQVDPADVVREVWANLQRYDRGDLGVTVTGSTSLRVGSTSEAKYNAANDAYKAAKATYEAERDTYTDLRAVATGRSKARTARSAAKTAANSALSAAKRALTAAKKTKDPAKIAAAQSAVNDAQAEYNRQVGLYNGDTADYKAADAAADAQATIRDAAKAKQDAAKKTLDAAKKVMDEDGGAYKMLWWEAPEAGKEISDLAQQTPFDYIETHKWNSTKSAISHEINVLYPRAGRRRDDIAFVQGENIIAVPDVNSNGDDYANTIFALGAGEGRAIKHTTTAVDDGRLRRVTVLNSKDTKTEDSLRAQSRDELAVALASLSIPQVLVRDHPNAPIGSWSLGDDVLIQIDVPFLGRLNIWHRITSWTLTSDSTATLKLARSDSFTYGK